jgi:phytanoyl-CoA hydroxylase
MTPEQRNEFVSNGFLTIRGLLDQAEVNALEANLARFLRDEIHKLPAKDVMFEDKNDPGSLKQMGFLEIDPWFDAFRHDPKFVGLAEDLLGGPVSVKNVQLFRKPPLSGRATPAHQDGFYFSLVPNEAVTIWIALDEADAANGAVEYVPGSHLRGVLPHGGTGVLGFSQGMAEPSAFGEPVLCPVRPGDGLLHHSLTIHLAGPNTSTRERRAIGLVYYLQSAVEDREAQARYFASLRQQRAAMGLEQESKSAS